MFLAKAKNNKKRALKQKKKWEYNGTASQPPCKQSDTINCECEGDGIKDKSNELHK